MKEIFRFTLYPGTSWQRVGSCTVVAGNGRVDPLSAPARAAAHAFSRYRSDTDSTRSDSDGGVSDLAVELARTDLGSSSGSSSSRRRYLPIYCVAGMCSGNTSMDWGAAECPNGHTVKWTFVYCRYCPTKNKGNVIHDDEPLSLRCCPKCNKRLHCAHVNHFGVGLH